MPYDVTEAVSKKAAKLLKELGDSCTSEGCGVADILNGIASNSGEMATDDHLVCCAQEIISWASHFMRNMGSATKAGRIAEAARKVTTHWESGDLAGAVRELEAALNS